MLGRILNVAVQQRLLVANPCQRVEFPARLSGTTRKPHYMTASEQERIEFFAPSYLRNVVIIMAEMGLRPYKELLCMQKSQVDLENDGVHIPDSKTPAALQTCRSPRMPSGRSKPNGKSRATPSISFRQSGKTRPSRT